MQQTVYAGEAVQNIAEKILDSQPCTVLALPQKAASVPVVSDARTGYKLLCTAAALAELSLRLEHLKQNQRLHGTLRRLSPENPPVRECTHTFSCELALLAR